MKVFTLLRWYFFISFTVNDQYWWSVRINMYKWTRSLGRFSKFWEWSSNK